jgi:transposase InsO family protein
LPAGPSPTTSALNSSTTPSTPPTVTRGSLTGAIFHSVHGPVYTSKDYARLCTELGVTQSMGVVGTSADNSLAESFNATLKKEVLQDHSRPQ